MSHLTLAFQRYPCLNHMGIKNWVNGAFTFSPDGNFVLAVSEGRLNDVHTSFFDLFRLESGRLVEHWDTIEAVPPRDQWLNDNGKF